MPIYATDPYLFYRHDVNISVHSNNNIIIVIILLFIIIAENDAVPWISYVLQLFRAPPFQGTEIILLLLWWDCLWRITDADNRPGELTGEEKENRKKCKKKKNTNVAILMRFFRGRGRACDGPVRVAVGFCGCVADVYRLWSTFRFKC